jgi:single-strand DNA-binding protein
VASLNKIFIIGNLTRDPELRYSGGGAAICKLGLAVNNKWTGADGNKHEEVTFFDCSAFKSNAENLAKYATKGQLLYVEGRMKSRTVETDGVKRTFWGIEVQGFQFLGGGKGEKKPQEQSGGVAGAAEDWDANDHDDE